MTKTIKVSPNEYLIISTLPLSNECISCAISVELLKGEK